MTTQTLQDIIGKEPFHWRGDRDGIEEFNQEGFVNLMGLDAPISDSDMAMYKGFLATITFPPNPFRRLDNSLDTRVDLRGHVTSDRFGSAGRPLGTGNAAAGFDRFRAGALANLPAVPDPSVVEDCATCHAMPTGQTPNAAIVSPNGANLGGRERAAGPNGENHLGVVAESTLTNSTMKTPQLRNLHEKVGFETGVASSRAGFGFLHDGSVDSLARLVSLEEFDVESDREVADLVAFLVSVSGSDIARDPKAPDSQDTHAGVGAQITIGDEVVSDALQDLLDVAASPRVDVVAHTSSDGRSKGWSLDPTTERFVPDDGTDALDVEGLLAVPGSATFTAVPGGLGARLGLDRDGDGVHDGAEIQQGSNPADAASDSLKPWQGLWYNPDRSGHGIDLQALGGALFATWFTYNDDGSPTWYQASGPFSGENWTGDLKRFEWQPATQSASGITVGSMSLSFAGQARAQFDWEIEGESGSEPFQRLEFASGRTPLNYLGIWFDPDESGWGLTVDTIAESVVAIAFFYDADNQPRWSFGSGTNARDTTINMNAFSGFCPSCDFVETTNEPAGTATLTFSSLGTARLDLDTSYPGLSGSRWVRNNTDIVPLNDPWNDPRSY